MAVIKPIIISSGVTSSNLTVTDYLHVYGTVLDSLVKSTGRIYVSSGGVASNITFEYNTLAVVEWGGRMNNTTLSGTLYGNPAYAVLDLSGGAALITGADTTTWAEYGALGSEWSTKGVGIL